MDVSSIDLDLLISAEVISRELLRVTEQLTQLTAQLREGSVVDVIRDAGNVD